VLLDENLPQKLRLLLIGHTVVTTVYQGWAGKSNGSLLATAEEAGFDVFVTADQGINYQQNMNSRTIALVVLSTNKNSLVLANTARILTSLDSAQPALSLSSILGPNGTLYRVETRCPHPIPISPRVQ